jgi:hypothetical protein
MALEVAVMEVLPEEWRQNGHSKESGSWIAVTSPVCDEDSAREYG